AKQSSPSRVRGRGVDAGLPALFYPIQKKGFTLRIHLRLASPDFREKIKYINAISIKRRQQMNVILVQST
ncbi:MAG: hypothetical protein J6D46_09560, partial [Lachnospiraceae bacterium]|nr:hypothetical protein [Lachnospiraceae bacterium]